MKEEKCPVCGQDTADEAHVCSNYSMDENQTVMTSGDRDAYLLSVARDYSAPENYPGY